MEQNCYDAMNDDFNTPILIAHLFEGVKQINLIKDGKTTLTSSDLALFTKTFHTFIFDVLGLTAQATSSNQTSHLDGTVNLLIEMRKTARQNKDFAMSDHIRDELAKVGIQLKDGKEGTSYSIN